MKVDKSPLYQNRKSVTSFGTNRTSGNLPVRQSASEFLNTITPKLKELKEF